ncbi:hypothetical protein C6I20_04610 [Aeromicrobium sp. A1-2]|nr:hypothetical protein C6I20_04610 [Aeromicrobium sp. A1-2]
MLRPVRDKLRAEGSDLEDLGAAEKEQALVPHDGSYFISMSNRRAPGSYVEPKEQFDRDTS